SKNKILLSIQHINEKSNYQSNIVNELEKYEATIGSVVFDYSIFPISQFHENEKLVGFIMNDISEAKHFQQKLFLNEKLIALGKVASGIAHEINNPLYAVLANAEEIADDPDCPEQDKEYADEIVEHVINVSNIIKDLSAYSKTLRKDDIDEVNLNDVIEDSIKIVKYGSNVLEVELNKELNFVPCIHASKGELQQVFINLFNNAIQAMGGKGKIFVNSQYDDETNLINISVSDTGSGIPDENLEKIFELFFTTKSKQSGTGQGLHIVKKIINKYQGEIKVESKVDEGTTFFLTFNIEN
ncbi:MAG: ATP-binding protein, partial [Spirochaetes bacterium]|nr:ATP-binding protein [Spirochaetota bacterium]